MKSTIRTGVMALAMVLVPVVWSVRADTFLLKDGTEVTGTVTYESDDAIHVDTSTGLVIVDPGDVRRRVVSPPPAEPLGDTGPRFHLRVPGAP